MTLSSSCSPPSFPSSSPPCPLGFETIGIYTSNGRRSITDSWHRRLGGFLHLEWRFAFFSFFFFFEEHGKGKVYIGAYIHTWIASTEGKRMEGKKEEKGREGVLLSLDEK